MLCISAAYVMRCLSVTIVYCVLTTKHILQLFYHRVAILVYQYKPYGSISKGTP